MNGKRSIAFKKAHEKAKKLESSGKILMSEDWKKIVSESWDDVKEEVEKVCSSVPPISEKPLVESVSEERTDDMREEILVSEEEPSEEEQPIEQDTDAIPEKPTAELEQAKPAVE